MQRNVLIALAIFIPVLISGYVTYTMLNRPKAGSPIRTSQLPVPTPTTPMVIDGLTYPSANASSEEIDRFYASALAKAQGVSEISLSSCNPTPLIIKVAPNKHVVIKNTDARERIISIGSDQTYTVPARGEVTITANFEQGFGVYGYQCDYAPGAVGTIVVTQL
jgi:hypothetical protein